MTDDELLAQVNEAFTMLDPTPSGVLDAGRAALGWRVPGAVLAELSADRDAAAAGLRGGTRLLTFTCPEGLEGLEGPEGQVEFEVLEFEIAGHVAREGQAEVLVRHPSGQLASRTDRHGRFIVSSVPSGLVSLVFSWPDATSIVTSWVRL